LIKSKIVDQKEID